MSLHTTHCRVLGRPVLGLLLLLLVIPNNNALAGDVDGGAIRAAYLLNFMRFTEWSEETFVNSESSLHLCLFGSKHSKYLFRLDGKTIGQRSISVKKINYITQLNDCHTLYFSGEDQIELEKIIPAIEGKAILSVSENMSFNQAGGLIRIFKENNKLRFNIDFQALQVSGLKIGSRLLRLAKNRHDIIDTKNHD